MTRPSRSQRQFKPQAERLLEQLRSVTEQYRGTIADADPDLGDALDQCILALREFLDAPVSAPDERTPATRSRSVP